MKGVMVLDFNNLHCEVIYQTREGVFRQKHKEVEVGWKNEAQPSFFF